MALRPASFFFVCEPRILRGGIMDDAGKAVNHHIVDIVCIS
jgi:hypothetical protein